MADDKVKLLGQSAADIPRIIAARMQKVQAATEEMDDYVKEDMMLQDELLTRFEKIAGDTRSFIDEAETKVNELHTISQKLWTIADQVAENTTEGGKRIMLELDALTSEIQGLDATLGTETTRIDSALEELSRVQEEMEASTTARTALLNDNYDDLDGKYDAAMQATADLNRESETIYLSYRDVCEKQKFHIEEKVTEWEQYMDGSVEVISEWFENGVKNADERMLALLAEADTFFESEVVEATNKRAEEFQSDVNRLRQAVDNNAIELRAAREWLPAVLQRITNSTDPLTTLLAEIRRLANQFSQGMGV